MKWGGRCRQKEIAEGVASWRTVGLWNAGDLGTRNGNRRGSVWLPGVVCLPEGSGLEPVGLGKQVTAVTPPCTFSPKGHPEPSSGGRVLYKKKTQ